MLRETCSYFNIDPTKHVIKDGNNQIWGDYLMVREELIAEYKNNFFIDKKYDENPGENQ